MLLVAFHFTMSESWLVELTDTTTVFKAGAESDWVAVLVPSSDPLEQPAHTHTATIATSAFGIRTIGEGISSAGRPHPPGTSPRRVELSSPKRQTHIPASMQSRVAAGGRQGHLFVK